MKMRARCGWPGPLSRGGHCDLTEVPIEGIRNRLRAGIQDIEEGNFQAYEGYDGLRRLIETVKDSRRKGLQQTTSRK